jgi:hypothetical protein
MKEEPPSFADDAIEERMLCPACLHPNALSAMFCSKCDAPLSAGAVLGPFEQIRAQRFVLHRAATGPSSPMVVFGVWLIFVPIVIASIVGVGAGLSQDDFSAEAVFNLVIFALAGVLSFGVIWRVTVNFRRQRSLSAQNEKRG